VSAPERSSVREGTYRIFSGRSGSIANQIVRDAAGNLKNPVVEYNPDFATSMFHIGSAGVTPGKRYYWALKFYVNGQAVFERGYVDAPIIVQGAGNIQVKP
jgi:hypothetical protein